MPPIVSVIETNKKANKFKTPRDENKYLIKYIYS